MARKPGSINYVDKLEFLNEIKDYQQKVALAEKLGKPKPKIPDKIALRFQLIAKNMAKLPCYSGYTFKDLMISDAIENMIRYFDNFDVNHPKQNPFGYFSQYATYAFYQRIFKERTELYTKYKMLQQSGVMHDQDYQNELAQNGDSPFTPEMYDNINTFIAKFEDDLRKSKLKETANKKTKPKKGLENYI